MGRHSIHQKPMTATERQRRWRDRLRRRKIWIGNPDSSARRPTPKRRDKDFWPTPPELPIALTRYVLPFLPEGCPVWENAAGDGDTLSTFPRWKLKASAQRDALSGRSDRQGRRAGNVPLGSGQARGFWPGCLAT
jgi:hypothetical protein